MRLCPSEQSFLGNIFKSKQHHSVPSAHAEMTGGQTLQTSFEAF